MSKREQAAGDPLGLGASPDDIARVLVHDDDAARFFAARAVPEPVVPGASPSRVLQVAPTVEPPPPLRATSTKTASADVWTANPGRRLCAVNGAHAIAAAADGAGGYFTSIYLQIFDLAAVPAPGAIPLFVTGCPLNYNPINGVLALEEGCRLSRDDLGGSVVCSNGWAYAWSSTPNVYTPTVAVVGFLATAVIEQS